MSAVGSTPPLGQLTGVLLLLEGLKRKVGPRGGAPYSEMLKKQITLAVQGGGSHGAFTWGVLERLLEDERIEIEGISGASAGAINAAVLTHGYIAGGREGACRMLAEFWKGIGTKAAYGLVPGGWLKENFRLIGTRSSFALSEHLLH